MRWMSLVPITATLCALLSITPPTAHAADGQACRADVRSLCGRMSPGGGRILACLKSHDSQLSDGCKAVLPALEQCAAEARALCDDSAGPAAARSCMRENAVRLSPDCQALLPQR